MEDVLDKGKRKKILEKLVGKVARDFNGDESKAQKMLDNKFGMEWRADYDGSAEGFKDPEKDKCLVRKIKQMLEDYGEASQDYPERMPFESEDSMPHEVEETPEMERAEHNLSRKIKIIIEG